MAKLSERGIEILTKGSTPQGYARKRDRGEGPAIAWLTSQGRIEQADSTAEVYRATEAGKQALAEHKAALKGSKKRA